jgi:transposase-like protein
MIIEEIRQAIVSLYQRGIHIRQIGQILKISRNTVRDVIRGKKKPEKESPREELSSIVNDVFAAVSGNAVRVNPTS